MDTKLKKTIAAVEPKRSAKKRIYEVPLRPVKRGADRRPEGNYRKEQRRPEAEEFFFSIDWQDAWQQFLKRQKDGRFKYKTARQLARALSIGIDVDTRRRRAGYLYRAIGPASAADKKKQVPYLGDWDMTRSQGFLGEMKKDSLLFGTPRMKAVREAMRKHVDVMEVAKACAETMLTWLARYQNWSQQVDEHFEYKLFDEKLSAKQNKQRLREYVTLQRQLHGYMADSVEHVLRCYGVGKDDISLLAQMMVAAMKPRIGDQATQMMMANLAGVKVIDGKMNDGGVVSDDDAQDDPRNPTLRLITDSFLAKSITYKMPHPEVSIPGVPDEEEQATPREHIKKAVRAMMVDGGNEKIQ